MLKIKFLLFDDLSDLLRIIIQSISHQIFPRTQLIESKFNIVTVDIILSNLSA